MTQELALVLVVSWLSALLLTPLVMRLATAYGILDHPDLRKGHATPVPYMGGIAVFASMAFGIAAFSFLSEPIWQGLWGWSSLGALGLGTAAIVALGAWDDLRDVRAPIKAAVQTAVAIATWWVGFRVSAVELPFGWVLIDTPMLSFLVTVAWIVVVTNAFNLIDGVDGLAAGTSIAAALTIYLLAAHENATVPLVASLALSGSLAGFLRFNLPPAKIYLGDAGAMGIGYTTAVLSISSFQKSPTAVVLIVPLLILGLPLLDTLLAILRRAWNHLRDQGLSGLHPGDVVRAVMRADRGHIHDLLLRSGWSVRSVLLILYLISAGLGAIALWTRTASATLRWSLWLGLMLAGFGVLTWVRRRAERLEQLALARDVAATPDLGAPVPSDSPHRAAG